MVTYKTGDKVKVFDVNGPSHGMPESGWDGEIVKVGTKLVTIEYGHTKQTFRIVTGSANDDYGHQMFMTIEAARRHVAKKAITGRGFQIAEYARHDIEYLESVAAALRALPNPRL